MNKKCTVTIALFFIMAGLLLVTSLPAQVARLCCVAGTYEGSQVNYAKPNCPRPKSEKFTMIIKQDPRCGAAVEGTVVDSSGTVNNWTGTLSRGLLRGCCVLEGKFLTPSGNTTTFRGTLCLKLGKWHAKGTWVELKSSDPCRGSGTWVMNQV